MAENMEISDDVLDAAAGTCVLYYLQICPYSGRSYCVQGLSSAEGHMGQLLGRPVV
jgi:hypothetical protein